MPQKCDIVGKTRKMRKKLVRILTFFMILTVFYLIIVAVSISTFSKVDEKCKADVAIVLGAGATDSEVSPVFRERINHGIWLYENGYVNAIILTGGIGKGNEKSDAYIAKQYAIQQGIPEKDIYIEETSTITQENIKNAKEIMNSNAFNIAIIVSDPLHMKRAMLMAKDYKIKAYSSPTPTSRYISIKSKVNFLLREEFFYVGYRVYRIFK